MHSFHKKMCIKLRFKCNCFLCIQVFHLFTIVNGSICFLLDKLGNPLKFCLNVFQNLQKLPDPFSFEIFFRLENFKY